MELIKNIFDCLISFFGAAYRLYLFSYSQHRMGFYSSFGYYRGSYIIVLIFELSMMYMIISPNTIRILLG
ncbi:Protein of unknown function [Gryllus bimaculatus]|nr:Protein of unknown function [Gryllus bimaculatus]